MLRACLAAVALLFLAFADPLHAERLPITSYTTADGLAHNVVNRIVRDSRGFMWFATEEGLSRFDGYTFTNYGVEQGLPHAKVTDLLETKSGELWVATFGGLGTLSARWRGLRSRRPRERCGRHGADVRRGPAGRPGRSRTRVHRASRIARRDDLVRNQERPVPPRPDRGTVRAAPCRSWTGG